VAFESDEELQKRFPGEIPRYAKATKTDFGELMKEFAAVRERGYATDLEEFEEGLRCIASPVRDYTRKVVGAVSVSGPAHRLTDEKIAQLVGPEVERAGRALSTRLGFRE
jgi:DNA-binding IclR family transcriptional regulator